MKRAVLLAVAVCSVSPLARADQSKIVAAEALFAEGRRLFKDGNYAAACPKFDESNRLDPAVGTEFNLADCEERIGHVATAWMHWRSVVQALASRPTDVRVPIANDHLAKLEPKLPRLAVRLADDAPSDATIVRDGIALERAAIGTPLPIDPGESVIEVRAAHHAPRQFKVRMVEGQTQNVVVTVGDVVADPTPQPTEMVADRGRRILAGVVTGVGLVGIGVGSAFGLSAASQNSDAKSKCPSPSNCDPTANDEIGRAQKAGNVSTIAFVAGGALVATGVVLWITAPRVAVVPVADARSAGVFVRGTF